MHIKHTGLIGVTISVYNRICRVPGHCDFLKSSFAEITSQTSEQKIPAHRYWVSVT